MKSFVEIETSVFECIILLVLVMIMTITKEKKWLLRVLNVVKAPTHISDNDKILTTTKHVQTECAVFSRIN